jgi:transcriptional regulator with XRE-family HTH domain
MTINKKLSSLRENRNLTLRQAEELSGVLYPTIYRLESGDIQDPKYKHVKQLMTAYGEDTSKWP